MLEKLNTNFDKFVYGIGGIPKTYLESLSYEEQLLWFCKNLSEVIENINYAIGVDDYETLIENLNSFDKGSYNIGQSFKIKTLNVPDLWVSEILENKVEYTYVSDEEIINNLLNNGYIQVGYFKLMSMEILANFSNYITRDELNNKLLDYELLTNKVTSLSSTSTDNEYPSAKCVYDIIGDVESLLGGI